MDKRQKQGFTLLEISIVIVIIGLIAGAVLAGKDLIEAASMRSQISQFDELNKAAIAFKLKYNCIPGDCPNATEFMTFPTGTGQNGDGNGFLQYPAEQCCPFNIFHESVPFMSMLNLSGIYPAAPLWSFTSQAGIVGQTILAAKLGGGGIIATYMYSSDNRIGGNGFYWGINSRPDTVGNPLILHYARPDDSAPGYQPEFLNSGVITPAQAYNFDQKTDDGLPSSGKVSSVIVNSGSWTYPDGGVSSGVIGYFTFGCVKDTPSVYDVTRTDKACSLFVKGNF